MKAASQLSVVHASFAALASLTALGCLIVLGCSGSDAAESEQRSQDGSDLAAEDAGASGACAGRAPPLDELAAKNGDLEVTLLDYEPSPLVAGDNTLVVELTASGEALTGAAETVTVSPRMPDHGHGTPVSVGVEEEGNGVYRLSPVNTFMPGYWELEVEVDDIESSVILGVCIE